MYVGRIVAIGRSAEGRNAGFYRVSSRSFPNRHCVLGENSASVVPKPGYEPDLQRSPYIAYNCIRTTGETLVLSNGAHTDPIAEKIEDGLPWRDSLVLVLLSMDFERDKYATPRIAAVVGRQSTFGYLAIVRQNALFVRAFTLEAGTLYYVCTYERNECREADRDENVNIATAEQACDYVLGQGSFAEFEHPVAAAAGLAITGENAPFELSVKEAGQ